MGGGSRLFRITSQQISVKPQGWRRSGKKNIVSITDWDFLETFYLLSLIRGWSEIGEEAPESRHGLWLSPTGKNERTNANMKKMGLENDFVGYPGIIVSVWAPS